MKTYEVYKDVGIGFELIASFKAGWHKVINNSIELSTLDPGSVIEKTIAIIPNNFLIKIFD